MGEAFLMQNGNINNNNLTFISQWHKTTNGSSQTIPIPSNKKIIAIYVGREYTRIVYLSNYTILFEHQPSTGELPEEGDMFSVSGTNLILNSSSLYAEIILFYEL